jgi:hypothetical protein
LARWGTPRRGSWLRRASFSRRRRCLKEHQQGFSRHLLLLLLLETSAGFSRHLLLLLLETSLYRIPTPLLLL